MSVNPYMTVFLRLECRVCYGFGICYQFLSFTVKFKHSLKRAGSFA